MQRFRGSYEAKIDDRGRIKIPAKFLSVFDAGYGRDLYVTSLEGDHVIIYPMKIWERVEFQIENAGILDPDVDAYVNRLSYWGTEAELDSKGRVLVPPALRKEGQLDEVVRVLGKANHLVIWNEENFRIKELGEPFGKEKLQKVSRILNEISAMAGQE
jgi:MraZ protein